MSERCEWERLLGYYHLNLLTLTMLRRMKWGEFGLPLSSPPLRVHSYLPRLITDYIHASSLGPSYVLAYVSLLLPPRHYSGTCPNR